MSGRVHVDARTVALEADALDPAEVVEGDPATASVALADVGGVEVGVWEITPGSVRDVESDEVFVVLEGDATVHVDGGETIELGPGSLVRLNAGERTTWEVRTTLRKVYLA